MRTRRSPRNQDRLFKALFKPPDEPKPQADEVERLQELLNTPGRILNRRTRGQLERDLKSALHKRAVKRALEGGGL